LQDRWRVEHGTGMSRFQQDQSLNISFPNGAGFASAVSHVRLQALRCRLPLSAACARISEHLARLA
ncbi:hypothetical protein, partial [Massilia sp.]|uniref:hypothetical protein n=1 Tax=Massilia sp. TaxID=1882437 RepID=UPI0028AF53F1